MPKALALIQQDPYLSEDKVQEAVAARSGGLTFTTAAGLSQGVPIFDAYMAPLLGALAPNVWALHGVRTSGVVVLPLGEVVRGLHPEPLNALDLLPTESMRSPGPPGRIPVSAGAAAVHWWTARLNDLFAWLSDPAVFQDATGNYAADGHLEFQLSVEQVFRTVSSVQRSFDDPAARRASMFTALDTLQGRLTGRTIAAVARYSIASKLLDQLKNNIPPDAQPILLAGAERAVAATLELQQGFNIPRTAGGDNVALRLPENSVKSIPLDIAGGEYLELLRNATHGFGGKPKSSDRARNRALLVHHNGEIPHELASLAYLQLLGVLNSPKDTAQFVRGRMRAG